LMRPHIIRLVSTSQLCHWPAQGPPV